MPNGADKNFVRLCAVLDGFKERYGAWPTQVVMGPIIFEDLHDRVLGPRLFRLVNEKVQLTAAEDAFMRAEDDEGHSYEVAKEGFPEHRPRPPAEEWLGVEPICESW